MSEVPHVVRISDDPRFLDRLTSSHDTDLSLSALFADAIHKGLRPPLQIVYDPTTLSYWIAETSAVTR